MSCNHHQVFEIPKPFIYKELRMKREEDFEMPGKVIKDPVHGFIELNKIQEELLEQPELQRLAWIKQLGLTFLVYPGAHQTRLEHSLGTSHLAGKVAEKLSLDEKEKKTLEVAGMLHDLGHAPFSHTVEEVMPRDHMEITKGLIKGEEKTSNRNKIPEIIEKHGLNPEKIAKLVNGEYKEEKHLQDIISSQLDIDQLDYLARDSYYTGVSYGSIETDRIIDMMQVTEEDDGKTITFLEKGITPLEDYLVARDHMYSNVYCHKTAAIAEKMLLRSFQSAVNKIKENKAWLEARGEKGEKELKRTFEMTDGELLQALRESNPYSREIIKRITRRKLYKQCYSIKTSDTEEKKKKLDMIIEKEEKKIEKEIAEKGSIDPEEVIVNKQRESSLNAEPRLREFDIMIKLKNSETARLEEVSKITKALKSKQPVSHIFSVYTTPENRGELGKTVEKYLK